MKRLTLSSVLAVILSAGGNLVVRSEASLCLVRDGQPVATIVLASEPSRSAQFAAAELQYHIRKITGATLLIASEDTEVKGARVLVGESKATQALGLRSADFKSQEYLVRFQRDAVVLMGSDKDDQGKLNYNDPQTFPDFYVEQGTCYAVYDFLEKSCEVRWYLPTELGIVHPTTATLIVKGKEIRRSPAMRWRSQTVGYQLPADLCGDNIKGKEPTPVLPWREQMLWWHRQRLGGEAYSLNHSFYGYYDRFLKDHPDWFAQGYTGKPPQLCFTNPELIQQVVQDARDFFDGKGSKAGSQAAGDYFALVPMDNGAWCKCPRCRPLWLDQSVRAPGQFTNDKASDYVLGFANAVAREVRKTHPDKWIAAAAYADYAYPPSKEKMEPNVSVQMCLHARNVESPSLQENDLKVLQAWVADSKERPKYLWLYYCFPSLVATQQQFRCFPGFVAHTVVKKMKLYHQSGVRGLYYEPSYLAYERRSPLLDQLECYLTWKLADDPKLNGDKLIDEFFTRYYGAAAKPMQEFYCKVEAIYGNPNNYPKDWKSHQTEQAAWGYLGTEERMTELGVLMDQARAAATTGIEKQRVDLFDKGIWQSMVAGRKSFVERDKLKTPTLQRSRAPRLPAPSPNGDLTKVNWSTAGVLANWRHLTGETSPRKVKGRVAHDGKFLYLQLEEQLDPKKLIITDDNVWAEDEWEIFFARQRGRPYRQMGVNANGVHIDLRWGEETEKWDSGAKVVSDTSSADRWRLRIAFPLARLLPNGAQPGDVLYLNIIRSSGQSPTALAWIPTFSGYHEPNRLGEVTLEK